MFKPQMHLEPISNKNGFGTVCEYVEVHTYDADDITALALINVRGSNMDDHDQSIELWVREDEVIALRDALTSILGQPEVIGPPNTKEQNIAFRKDWDRRYEEGRAREQRPS